MQRMGVEPNLCIWRNILINMLQFDANAHADANVDARVNGPLSKKNANADITCESIFYNLWQALLRFYLSDNKLFTHINPSLPLDFHKRLENKV